MSGESPGDLAITAERTQRVRCKGGAARAQVRQQRREMDIREKMVRGSRQAIECRRKRNAAFIRGRTATESPSSGPAALELTGNFRNKCCLYHDTSRTAIVSTFLCYRQK
jgi:hypothetical protein